MADKEEPKEYKPHESLVSSLTEIVVVVALVMVILGVVGGYLAGGNIWASIWNFFERIGIAVFLNNIAIWYLVFVNVLSILLVVGIIYTLLRIIQIEKDWHDKLYPKTLDEEGAEETGEKVNERWQRVIDHVSSTNPSDWRLAILEADIILDDLLDSLGAMGETVGEKLKKINPGDFKTLDDAWEAHKVRNAIAHEGKDFTLTDREARRVVGLYQNVFEEFDYIYAKQWTAELTSNQ